jgi:hypothetical protein
MFHVVLPVKLSEQALQKQNLPAEGKIEALEIQYLKETLTATYTACPTTPGSAFPVAVPRPTDGILAPVLRRKNSAI